MGIPFYVICCFSLAAFSIFSLYLIFDTLINMSWHVSPWIYPVWDSLCFLDLIDYFFSYIREVFNYNLFKYFLSPFFSSSGTPIFQMLVHLMLSQRSLKLSSIPFFLFFFILLCNSYFHYFIFQVTYPFFFFSYCALDSF